MKSTVLFFALILLFGSVAVCCHGVEIIRPEDVTAIANRNASSFWGDVYPDEPVPYYDRNGQIVVWQFNYSIGKPFPNKEELKQQCRQSASKLWNENWNSENFANIIMGARTDKPVIIGLSRGLSYDYSYLSALFSEVEGTTIEKYAIAQKIEKVKELLVYDELSLSEIAYRLSYSSVAHLSNQFKKVTGLTPGYFRKMKPRIRKPLDEV